MLTLFAIPKAFRGHINTIQRNAIISWTLLHSRPEIILLGSDEGTAEIAQEFNLQHVPDVACNEYGTPLLNSLFEIAQTVGKGSRFAYVNADIILMNDFMAAVQNIPFERFMLTGQRWNLDVEEAIDFNNPDWENQLRSRIAQSGRPEGPQAMDYFVFPHGIYQELPPFAIGRVYWDNWLLYKAMSADVPVIDATTAIMAIHQNHDYNHHPQGRDGIWQGAEAANNEKLVGGRDYAFFMLDLVNWLMTPQGLQKPQWTQQRLNRCLEMLPLVRPEFRGWAALLKNLLEKRLYIDLGDTQMTQLFQNLGEAFFANPSHWFWFSLDATTDEAILYLPTPAQREAKELRMQLQQTQAELEQLKAQAERSHLQFQHTQAELAQLRSVITGMESTKFWKLRTTWFKLKRRLRLVNEKYS